MSRSSMKTGRYGFVYLSVLLFAGGCRTLPKISLEPCVEQDTTQFIELFKIQAFSDSLRCQYRLNRKSMTFTFDGIIQKQGGAVFLAGFNDSGITLFSARWEHEKFVILKNNTRMPEVFLHCILADLMLPYCLPADNKGCVFTTLSDHSLWLRIKDKPGNMTGYYVIDKNRAAWKGLKHGQLCYQADFSKDINSDTIVIDISHLEYNYRAKMILIPETDQGVL